jgi:hypothetical protein
MQFYCRKLLSADFVFSQLAKHFPLQIYPNFPTGLGGCRKAFEGLTLFTKNEGQGNQFYSRKVINADPVFSQLVRHFPLQICPNFPVALAWMCKGFESIPYYLSNRKCWNNIAYYLIATI